MTRSTQTQSSQYIGRFAPSPSGPLHFGSLVAALASYLDAKHHHGQWLVRMEDIDPPREEHGAKERILTSLQAHGLQWDGDVRYQSHQLERYAQQLKGLAFASYSCQCTRQRLKTLDGIYDNHCYQHSVSPQTWPTSEHSLPTSTRLHIDPQEHDIISDAEHYTDLFQGKQTQSLRNEVGDFILQRKDGLFAYQLAVCIDDIEQGITHIVRGSDLLPTTHGQRYLTLLLKKYLYKNAHYSKNTSLPQYGHIPVATNANGDKLSKQKKAPPIDDALAFNNLCRALIALNHPAPIDIMQSENIHTLVEWAKKNWRRENIPRTLSFVVDSER